jgi:imidazolonepropionase-like amidohydrolase
MMRQLSAAALLMLVLAPQALRSQESAKIALVGGRVYPITGAPIDNGVVLMNGDTIEAVGAGLTVPAGYERVSVAGQSVFPGLINASTALGLVEYGGLVPSAVDDNETTDPVTPQMRVTDALRLDSRNMPVARKYGITTVLVAPGESNVFAGQSAVVSLAGGQDVVVKAPQAMHINMGEPPRAYGQRNRMPMTRMGIAAIIRQTLIDAQQYAVKKQKDPNTATDARFEALLPVLDGRVPAYVRAARMDDILTALRLTDEFKLKTVLVDGVDAYKVADELAKRNIPVLLGPTTTQPDSIESSGAVYENAALLHNRKVRIAITTGGAQQAGQLPFEAGMAAAYGLDRDEALRAITINPAQILGIADRFGSLEKGKIADVVVAEGLILQPRAKVTRVYIRGKAIDLRTWQEDFRDQYMPRGAKPPTSTQPAPRPRGGENRR